MQQDMVYKRSDLVTFETIAGEAILIRMDSGTYFSLNQVGTDFWQLLDGETAVSEHAASIAVKYNHKADELAEAIGQLAVEKGDQTAPQRIAERFDLEVDFILSKIEAFDVSGNASQQKSALASEFYVPVEMVQADLIELAENLLTDRLIEAV